ncbi:PREDICTED: uncharacterized protein LOC101365903 [Odobenus rosmarus divergens]|uniref:Uncharacterized protein LOC101365903 n=1 Tax=Odobenus rosmarus divergens TaxID=9708 RepID=A0A9B0GHN1_ODORO
MRTCPLTPPCPPNSWRSGCVGTGARVRGGVWRQLFSAQPSHSSRRTRRRRQVRARRGRGALSGLLDLGRLRRGSAPGRERPAWLRLRPRHQHRPYDEGPGADRLLESPRPPRRGLLGLQIWWLSLLCLVLFFSLNSLLKVEAWGREKKTQCRKGRYELTCQRRRRKTPVLGELSSPRRDRSPGFARSGAAAAVPQPGVPPRRGPRYRARPLPWRRAPRPIASTLRKGEGGAVAPPPPSAGSWERKAPAHDLSTQQPAVRPPPASCSPLPPPPSPGQSAANPVTCPPGKTSSPVLRAARQAPWRLRLPRSAVRPARGLRL